MLNFQVTLSQFRCRKHELNLQNDQNITFRFGTIKLDIKIIQSHNGYFGGKRIVLDLSQDQIQQMFMMYAIGMFMENQYGKFFSILSLQKLNVHDIISKHEFYFYNDQQEIIYECNFSLNLKSLKNPRLPNNKQKIQNHKTFQQFFTKPPIPQNIPINAHQTMTSFLYGNKNNQIKSQKNIGRAPAQRKNNNKAKTTVKPSSKTGQNWNKKTGNIPSNNYMNTQQLNYNNYNNKFTNNNTFKQSLDDDDINPPVMQFTNKQQQDPRQKVNLLQTQLRQLNNSAPEYIKFQTVINNTNAFSKNKQNSNNKANHHALTSNINEKLDSQQRQITIGSYSKIPNHSHENIKVDREQLKNKAKKQLQGYQSNNSIKIPIFKDGKYEYVDISNLNDQEIKKFALQQKAFQQQQKQKLLFAQKLQEKQKQNLRLKKQLEQKQRLMIKKQQQVNKKQYELMMQTKKNKQLENLKKQQLKSNTSSNNNNNKYQDSYDESKSSYQESEPEQEQNQQKSQNQQYYEQDFESQSQAMSQLKSRLSIQSSQHKKQQQSYSYDSNDFESFSQSLLDSQKRLSQDDIDNAPSYKQVLKKKYGY